MTDNIMQDNVRVYVSDTTWFDIGPYETFNRKLSLDGNKYTIQVGGRQHTIDRVDGPAIIYGHGLREWISEGVLHRADGPACYFEFEDEQFIPLVSYKHWYVNGKRHRENGPAVEYSDGSEEWWVNDQLHREDGPAVTTSMIDQEEYWLNNNQMSKEEWQAATNTSLVKVFFFDEEHNQKGMKEYLSANDLTQFFKTSAHGKMKIETSYGLSTIHCDDGPAIIWADGTREWVVNGQHHREDGPAIEQKVKSGWGSWYKHGKLHRLDGPAEIFCLREGDQYLTYKNWFKEGQLHREDGPAAIIENQEGDVVARQYFKDGLEYDFTGLEEENMKERYFYQLDENVDSEEMALSLAAEELSDAIDVNMNLLHVLDVNGKPALLACNMEAFEEDVFQEDDQWYINGAPYAADKAELNGNLLIHRENDMPAILYADGHLEWLCRGQLHRINGPAVIDNDGSVEWHVEGMLHREDGPARSSEDGHKEYWLFGEQVPEEALDLDVPLKEEEALEQEQWEGEEEKGFEGEVPDSIPIEVNLGDKTAVSVRVKVKNGDMANELLFFDENQYIGYCYRDPDGKYKIKIGEVIDAFIHCDDGPAAEYADGRLAYCIDGVPVNPKVVETKIANRKKDNAQVIVFDENRDPVYVPTVKDLYDKILVIDGEGQIRFQDTGKLLSNKYDTAIVYADNTGHNVINGIGVPASSLCSPVSTTVKTDLLGKKWTHVSGREFRFVHGKASFNKSENFGDYWVFTLQCEEEQQSYDIVLFFNDLQVKYKDLDTIVNTTKMSPQEAFSTSWFAHNFLSSLARQGMTLLANEPVIKSEKQQEYVDKWNKAAPASYEVVLETKTNNPKVEESGFGLPLACLAIAGLTGIATNRKAKKARAHKNNVVAPKAIQKEKAHVAARR